MPRPHFHPAVMKRFFFVATPLLATLGLILFGTSNTDRSSTPGEPLSDAAMTWLLEDTPDEPLIEPWEAPTRFPDRIALTWQQDPATSLSVTWRTDTTVTAAMAQIALATPSPRFDRYADTLDATTDVLDTRRIGGEHVKAHYHAVTVTGLLPDTLYAYRVGDGEAWSAWYQTRTARARPAPFSFLYFGDAQNDLHAFWSRTIRMAYTMAPQARFIIHAGDLVNRAHRNVEWGQWFEAGGWIHGMLPIVPVPGNHEYQRTGEEDAERQLSIHWRPQFTLPENGVPGLEETVYYIDYQGVRFIGLDSNRRLEDQAAWLDWVLTDNPHPWALATFHHPVFSSSGERDNPALRTLWQPILERHRVDLVMQGHDHTYARGRVLNLAEGTAAHDAESGTVYVNSVSGPKMYAIKESRWSGYGATMERAAENTQLFQVIHIDGDTLSYEAYTTTGHLYDAFDLIKQPGGPNRLVPRLPPGTSERTHENTIPYRIDGP